MAKKLKLNGEAPIDHTTRIVDRVITIPLDTYNILLDEELLLRCLEEAGVDNWEGYSEAVKLYRKRSNVSKD